MRLVFFIFFLILLPFTVCASDFEEKVRELVSEKLGNQLSFDVVFESNSKLEKIIAKENLIKDIALNYFSADTRSFKVVVIFNHNETIELFGKFEAYFEVPVATRTIRFNEELSPDDIRIVKVKKLKTGQIPIKNPSELVGMQAKYNISAGYVIKISELKKPPVIKENDPVTLLYKSHDISLKTVGIALASGAVGEKIRVKNEKTGIIVFGEIMDKNVVRVSDLNEK